jgi:SNF2 family DNA or RNA helicase
MDKINDKVDRIASRMKKIDCLDLPPVTVSDILFDLGPRQVERYNEIVREMQISFTEDDLPKFALLPHGAARVTKLLQLTSGFVIKGKDYSICTGCEYIPACVVSHTRPYTLGCDRAKEAPPDEILRDIENVKLDVFESFLENILTSDDTNKVICWGCFFPELDDMESVCKRRGWKHIRIDGRSSRNIKTLQAKFQEDPEVRVCVGQVASGIGINLTAANYVIYYALPWDRLQYDQSKDRNHRPGQDRPVTIYRLLAKETLSVYLAALLQFKSKIAYTLSEKITCVVCSDQERCAKQQFHPFHKGCKYQSDVTRPIAKAVEV